MRQISWLCIAVLCGSLGALSTRAAGDQPLGVIDVAQDSRVDGLDATAGADFYAGEEFVTNQDGTMKLRIRDCRIDLGVSTDARFLPDSHPDHLQVLQGTARYSCRAGAMLLIETPAGIVHGADGKDASGMVVINDAHNLVISAYGDGLVLDNDGEIHLIAAGESYRVTVSDESADASLPESPEDQNQRKHKRRKLAMWLIGGGAVAFGAAELYEQWSESPYKPKPSAQAVLP